MELKVYSTKAGEIPLMVKKGEAACFVPYVQALMLENTINVLNCQVSTLQGAENSWQKGYDRGRDVATQFYQQQVKDVEAYAARLKAELDTLKGTL